MSGLIRSSWAPAVHAVAIGAGLIAPVAAQTVDATPTADRLLFDHASALTEWRTIPAFRDLDSDKQEAFARVFAHLSPAARTVVRAPRPRAAHRAYLEAVAVSRLADASPSAQVAALTALAELEAPWLAAVADHPALFRLATAAGTARLGADNRAALLATAPTLDSERLRALTVILERWSEASWRPATLVELISMPSFHALSPAEGVRLMRLWGGTNDEVSWNALTHADKVRRDSAFIASSTADKTETLRTMLRDQPDLNGRMRPPKHLPVLTSVTLDSGVLESAAPLHTGVAPAVRHTLSVDGRALVLHVAAGTPESGFVVPSAELIRDALRLVPKAARDRIGTIQILTLRSPFDAHWATAWNQPGFRAHMSATAAGGVLAIFPAAGPLDAVGLAASLIHEAAHFDGHARWGPSDSPGAWPIWRAAIAADALLPSGYARGNADEDYAEAYSMYWLTRGTEREAELRELFPARFAVLDAQFATTAH